MAALPTLCWGWSDHFSADGYLCTWGSWAVDLFIRWPRQLWERSFWFQLCICSPVVRVSAVICRIIHDVPTSQDPPATADEPSKRARMGTLRVAWIGNEVEEEALKFGRRRKVRGTTESTYRAL